MGLADDRVADPQVVEMVALDLIDVEDGVGPHHEDGLLLLFALFLFFGDLERLEKMMPVPHWPGSTLSGRRMTCPPISFHWLNVPQVLDLRP